MTPFKKSLISGEGVPEVSAEETFEHLAKINIIDVRRPDEFNAELGHIKGARLVTLGPELTQELAKLSRDEPTVFVCRSGGRSGTATALALNVGLKNVYNLQGGMILWNSKGLKVERSA